MKLTLRRRSVATAGPASASRPAILPGYRPWDAAGILSRHKRKLIVAFFVVTFFYSAFFQLMPRAMAIPLLIPVAVIWCVVIWALPISEYQPSENISRLFWAYTCGLFLWPNYLAISIPGLPWITVSRLFCTPMVALLLIYVSNCGPFRRELRTILAQSPTLVRYVTAFAVVQLLSTFFSSTPISTLNRMISNQTIWTAIFFVTVWTMRRAKSIHRWLCLYLFLATVLCIIGYFEAKNQGILWANHIPSFLKVDDPSVARILDGAWRLGSQYRVVATSTTALSLAELLGAASPFVLYGILEFRSYLAKASMIFLDILLVYTIVLTDSRLGHVAMIVGHCLYALYFTWRIQKSNLSTLIKKTILVLYPVAITLAISSVLFVGRINNAVIGDGRQTYSDGARLDQISDGLLVIFKSPLLGFGTGQGAGKLGYTNRGGTLTIDTYYLSILLDYGLIGFFVFYGLLIVAIYKAALIALSGTQRLNHLGAAFGIFLTIFLVTKAVLSQELNHPLIFVGLGIVAALAYHTGHREERTTKSL